MRPPPASPLDNRHELTLELRRIRLPVDHDAPERLLSVDEDEIAGLFNAGEVDVARGQFRADRFAVFGGRDHNGRLTGEETVAEKLADQTRQRLPILVEAHRVQPGT